MNLGYSNSGKNLTGERKVVFSTVDITGKLIIDDNGQFISSGSAVFNDLYATNISSINASFEYVEFDEYYAVVSTIENLSCLNASVMNLSFTNTLNNIPVNKFNYISDLNDFAQLQMNDINSSITSVSLYSFNTSIQVYNLGQSYYNTSTLNISLCAWNMSTQVYNLSQSYYSTSTVNLSLCTWNISSQLFNLSQSYYSMSTVNISLCAWNTSTQVYNLSKAYYSINELNLSQTAWSALNQAGINANNITNLTDYYYSVSFVAWDAYNDVQSLTQTIGNINDSNPNDSNGLVGMIFSVSTVASDAYNDTNYLSGQFSNLSQSHYNLSGVVLNVSTDYYSTKSLVNSMNSSLQSVSTNYWISNTSLSSINTCVQSVSLNLWKLNSYVQSVSLNL